MTYEQFVAEAKAGQRQYIADERERYGRLKLLWQAYRQAAHELGLHALDRREIEDRFDQLRGMEARVDETHGDSPAMRSIYAMQVPQPVIPPPPY